MMFICSYRCMICSFYGILYFFMVYMRRRVFVWNRVLVLCVCVCVYMFGCMWKYVYLYIRIYIFRSDCIYVYERVGLCVYRFGEFILSMRLGIYLGFMCIVLRFLDVYVKWGVYIKECVYVCVCVLRGMNLYIRLGVCKYIGC